MAQRNTKGLCRWNPSGWRNHKWNSTFLETKQVDTRPQRMTILESHGLAEVKQQGLRDNRRGTSHHTPLQKSLAGGSQGAPQRKSLLLPLLPTSSAAALCRP